MKFITTFLFLSISLFAFNQIAYNAAESGLLVRNKPDTLSTTIGKLKFGEEVQIVERTHNYLTVTDRGNQIKARWYKIASVKDKTLTGYVFSGYLTEESLFKKRHIQLNGFNLTISKSSKKAFESQSCTSSDSGILDEKRCVELGLIQPLSLTEVEIKLSDNSSKILKKQVFDEQFSGYRFLHYDSIQQLYFFWENWLEAGHPIMVEASTGKITELVSSQYVINSAKNIIAFYGEDIGSGWTPNGIQLFAQNENLDELFNFDPRESLDERWGPVAIAWGNDNTLFIECLIQNADSGYTSIYKKLKFEKK